MNDALKECYDMIYKKADADVLRKVRMKMYDEAFEKDHESETRWDAGHWIRYELFQNVIKKVGEEMSVEV